MFQGSAVFLLVAIWYASITQVFGYAYNFNNVYAFCIGILIAYFIPSLLIRHFTEHYHIDKQHQIRHNK